MTKITELPAGGTADGSELGIWEQHSSTVTMTETTLSALASDNSFNDSGSGFVTAGFAEGDTVVVSGFTESANNLTTGVITALTAGKMTIGGTDGDGITDEVAGDSVTISKWVTVRLAYPTGAGALDDLTDVAITSPSDGDYMRYDSVSGGWLNDTLPAGGSVALDDLTDVAITSPADGDYMRYDSVSGGWLNDTLPSGSGGGSGTSFPGSPSTGDTYFRTDRGLEYYYDGTRWLTTTLFHLSLTSMDANLPFTTTTGIFHGRVMIPASDTYDVYYESVGYSSTLTAAGDWTVDFNDANGNFLNINRTTSGDGTSSIGSVSSAPGNIFWRATENSGAASFYFVPTLAYRLVG